MNNMETKFEYAKALHYMIGNAKKTMARTDNEEVRNCMAKMIDDMTVQMRTIGNEIKNTL